MFILAASIREQDNLKIKEILFQDSNQEKVADFAYGKWPGAVAGPYNTNVNKSKYFRKKQIVTVLLVWETASAMMAGVAPVAFVQETQEGFNPRIWMKNLPEAKQSGELR